MRLVRLGAILAALLLGGCFSSGPELQTARVMDNFKAQTKDRIVVDRNYEVGQRYRVQPGQVMIRNKLYTMAAEGAGGYRAPVNITAIGDGQRLDIAEGTQFRVSDRILVQGKLANLIPLGAAPPNMPDLQAIFANDNGTLVPATLRAGKVVAFTAFEVQPKGAQLLPITQESVKTSAGYVNYDLIYNGNETRPLLGCTPQRIPGQNAPAKTPAKDDCGSAPHLDLTLIQYDAVNPEAVGKATRDYYPVRNNILEVPGLRIHIHEVTSTSVVYEVTKDDNAYKKKP